MKALDVIKFRWFLIGFFSAQEGWNGEYPFCINDPSQEPKTIAEWLKEFKELLEKNDEGAIKLVEDFTKKLEEEKKYIIDVVDVIYEICKLLYK